MERGVGEGEAGERLAIVTRVVCDLVGVGRATSCPISPDITALGASKALA